MVYRIWQLATLSGSYFGSGLPKAVLPDGAQTCLLSLEAFVYTWVTKRAGLRRSCVVRESRR